MPKPWNYEVWESIYTKLPPDHWSKTRGYRGDKVSGTVEYYTHGHFHKGTTMEPSVNYIDEVNDGDRILDSYQIKACPYTIKVRGYWGAHDFEVWYRGKRLSLVEDPIKSRVMGRHCSASTFREIGSMCREYAESLGHIAAERAVDLHRAESKRLSDVVVSRSQDVIRAGQACEEAHANMKQLLDREAKMLHGHQAEKNALHNECQRLRDKLEDQSRNFSIAWAGKPPTDFDISMGRPVPELERLRRKNATLEREASNLRVRLDTAEGKAKE